VVLQPTDVTTSHLTKLQNTQQVIGYTQHHDGVAQGLKILMYKCTFRFFVLARLVMALLATVAKPL
jgi:hypothetical protein